MTEEAKKGNEGSAGETVSKADFDALQAKLTERDGALGKATGELDELKNEVLSDDYLDFLNNRDSGGTAGKAPIQNAMGEDEIERMSKKELLELAEKRAGEKFQGQLDGMKNEQSAKDKAKTQAEIANFAGLHDDFEKFRPTMYGLSTDPKYANLPLQGLYDKAKELVTGINQEALTKEKERQAKIAGEKPGGNSESFEKLKEMNATEAAGEALAEVKEKLGGIPPA